MTETRITVVVAESGKHHPGLLRFVLESEGCEVLSEAATPAAVVRAVKSERPDVVVFDGSTASSAIALTRAAAPGTKLVVTSATRFDDAGLDGWVDLSDILRELGPAVRRVCASGTTITKPEETPSTIVRPEWSAPPLHPSLRR